MLRGRVAVVTGAGRGIGRGVALELAAQGAAVVVNDFGVRLDGMEPESGLATSVVGEITKAGGRAVASAESVSDFDAAGRIVGQAIAAFGRIDIVVTCAGILRDRMIFNMAEEEFDAVLAVHLKGTFNCIRHASAAFRDQRFGRIIAFASGAGLFGNPGQANYGSAKAAIGGLTKAVARDLGRYGVTANAICPVAATRMTLTPAVMRAREIRKEQGIVREESALRQLENLTPEDVAPMVAYLASDEAAGVNGRFFLCAGTSYSLLSEPRPIKTIFKRGRWSLDELIEIVPQTLAEGLANPAPPRVPSQPGT